MFYTMKQKKTDISADGSMCKLVYVKKKNLPVPDFKHILYPIITPSGKEDYTFQNIVFIFIFTIEECFHINLAV